MILASLCALVDALAEWVAAIARLFGVAAGDDALDWVDDNVGRPLLAIVEERLLEQAFERAAGGEA